MHRILTAALLLSLVGNGVLLWRILDLGVTTTYLDDQNQIFDRTLNDLEKLLPSIVGQSSRASIASLATKSGIGVLDKGSDGLLIGTMYFRFSDGRLMEVRLR